MRRQPLKQLPPIPARHWQQLHLSKRQYCPTLIRRSTRRQPPRPHPHKPPRNYAFAQKQQNVRGLALYLLIVSLLKPENPSILPCSSAIREGYLPPSNSA